MGKKAKKLVFAEWKAAAQAHANDLGLLVDLWTEVDAASVKDSFERGVDPKAFVEEAFEEDLACMEGNADEYRQSLESELGEDE